MKRNIQHGTALFLLALLFVAPRLSAQSGLQEKLKEISLVTEVTPLESNEFAEKYLLRFTQPTDHRHPELGSFSQRVVVSHVGFDRPTLIVTEGYDGSYGLSPKYREELSRMFDANMVFVEYRYFNESVPQPKDWKYLTAESSADDLHAIREAFRQIYPGKWIATGISKGGQTTLLYRTFYPDDVDISVPYVAPLCYAAEDGRHEPFLRQVGTPEQRQALETYQLEVLKRKATLLPLFEAYCQEKGYKFRAPLEEIYDFCVLEYSFAFWQWCSPFESIPPATATDRELFDHLLAVSEPSYFAADSPTEAFFVQAARELGYYGYDIRPFKPYLSITTSRNYLHRLMLPEELAGMKFDKTLSRKIKKFLQREDPKMIFIYGENDPWTAAGATWVKKDKKKKNIHVFIQPGGCHLARIATLTPQQQEEVKALLQEWLSEDK